MTSSVIVLPYDQAAARWHARERARLMRGGKPPSFVDGQIAAVAAVHGGLVLVTRNVRDFTSFAGLEVESWFSTYPFRRILNGTRVRLHQETKDARGVASGFRFWLVLDHSSDPRERVNRRLLS